MKMVGKLGLKVETHLHSLDVEVSSKLGLGKIWSVLFWLITMRNVRLVGGGSLEIVKAKTLSASILPIS